MTREARWKRSSFSGAQSDCVEVKDHLVAVRDSKNPHVELHIDGSRLLDVVKSGLWAQ